MTNLFIAIIQNIIPALLAGQSMSFASYSDLIPVLCRNLPLNNRPRRGDVRQSVNADSVNKHRFSEPMESQKNHFNIELDWIKVILLHV